jgi:hypothetical protein
MSCKEMAAILDFSLINPKSKTSQMPNVQWNLSINPTHQGTREMCRIVQYVEYSGFILVNRNT